MLNSKTTQWILAALLLLGICHSAFSQNFTVIGKKFPVSDQVLELEIQEDTIYQFIVRTVKDKRVYSKVFNARQGLHYYYLGDIPNWNGVIDLIVIVLPKQMIKRSNLVQPNFLIEWDLFLEQGQLTPRMINFHEPKTLYHYSFSSLLFIFLLLFIGFIYAWKRDLVLAVLLSVLLSFLLLDARSIYEHFHVYNQVEESYPHTPPVSTVQPFIEQIKPLIRENPWTIQGEFKDEYYLLCVRYGLSEEQFVGHPSETSESTFIITQNPLSHQEILVMDNGFYLVQE